MATSSQNVTADQLISATVKYSNKDDASRAYDIAANVNIQNGQVSSFDNGEIRQASSENPDGMTYIAGFSSYSERTLNLNINNADKTEAQTIIEAVYAFMADVRKEVNANPVTA